MCNATLVRVLLCFPVTQIRVSQVLCLPLGLHHLHQSKIVDLVWPTLTVFPSSIIPSLFGGCHGVL